jgi:hypothetical protein
MSWFLFCLLFTVAVAALVCLPLLRHPSLPRGRKIVLALTIFLILVPAGIWLYGLLGVPLMAVL